MKSQQVTAYNKNSEQQEREFCVFLNLKFNRKTCTFKLSTYVILETLVENLRKPYCTFLSIK